MKNMGLRDYDSVDWKFYFGQFLAQLGSLPAFAQVKVLTLHGFEKMSEDLFNDQMIVIGIIIKLTPLVKTNIKF